MLFSCRGACLLVVVGWLSVSPVQAQLPAEGELKTLVAAPEMEVSLFAAEPMVVNPAAIDVDTHGRVWVAEIQFYRGGAKSPPADKIKVLEDTDGDGRADRVTVFADGLFAPMSVCVAGNKVYVATSPDLWEFTDADGDLKADGPPRKVLTGFGGHNHDHGAHSLVLGPDHKWWMSHGDAGFDVQGTDGSRAKYQWGAVLRGELDGSQLETVAVNFRNPYEVCVDSFGEAYLSDNDNDGNESVRICWILEGGNYGWFGAPPFGKQELNERLSPEVPYREHWHFRGYQPGFVPATLVTGFGSPTGIGIYESDAFGPKFQNAPLHTDAGPRECRVYKHQVHGYGMRATSETFLSTNGDNYFRPDDICTAPDGRLYVADWYDGGVGGHAYNNPDQGRIFLLTPKEKTLARREKPGPYTTVDDAIVGLTSPNLATQFLARERLLTAGAASVPKLLELVQQPNPIPKARALWVLDRIGGEARKHVVDQLASPEPAFRALAVRILRRHGQEYRNEILSQAGDSSDEVKREVLLGIRNFRGSPAIDALAKIANTYDGSDRYQLEAIQIAVGDRQKTLLATLEKNGPLQSNQFALLEVLAPERAAGEVLARLEQPDLDEATAKLAIARATNMSSLAAGRGLLKLTADVERSPALRRDALDKLTANMQRRGSWTELAKDGAFRDTLKALLADAELREPALRAIERLQLSALVPQLLELANNNSAGPDARQQAIRAAARLKAPGAVTAFRGLLNDLNAAVAREAVSGLVDLQDATSLREILSGEKFSPEVRERAVDRLVADSSGAIVLLKLIDEDRLSEPLKQQALAKATKHADANVRVLFEKFVPEDQRPKKLGAEISPDEILSLAGDANRGRNIFFKSSAAQCNQCHAVHGFGGTLGPELTKIGTKYERKTLLETILLPSKAIAPEFIPHLLETKSGQILAGFVVEKNDAGVTLKDVKNQTVHIAADDIEQMVPQQKSLMPELILSQVSAQDAADLLAFLTTLK